jgi:hypothetical protein
MSNVEVDWELAPEDAVFYANDYFRNERGDWWDERDSLWKTAGWTLEELLEFKDYQKRPEAKAKTDTGVSSDIAPIKAGAIKSDGGSSSYYDIQLPTWLIDKIKERGYIKTEELIEVMGSDFDLGNIIKCSVRINSLKNGVGKEGNSVEYDANKIIYSANRLKERERN